LSVSTMRPWSFCSWYQRTSSSWALPTWQQQRQQQVQVAQKQTDVATCCSKHCGCPQCSCKLS
jgi:hypothetical protein